MCDYCFPPHNPTKLTVTTTAAAQPPMRPDHRADVLEAILTDLIAEIREGGHPTHGVGAPWWVRNRADIAEARLREVTGDE